MFAVYASHADPQDPLAALVVGEQPEPVVPDGWTVVEVKAASVNHHDVWTLRGVGIHVATLEGRSDEKGRRPQHHDPQPLSAEF